MLWHSSQLLSAISFQDVGSSYEIPDDTVLQTFQLSMDKIIPYDLEKSQSIRIMAVFGVHDFLKVDELYIVQGSLRMTPPMNKFSFPLEYNFFQSSLEISKHFPRGP